MKFYTELQVLPNNVERYAVINYSDAYFNFYN